MQYDILIIKFFKLRELLFGLGSEPLVIRQHNLRRNF